MSSPPFFNPIGTTIPYNNPQAQSSSSSSSSSDSSSSQNLSPSILIIILILSIAVILSTSLCLILRYFNSKCNRRHRHNHSTTDNNNNNNNSGGGGGGVSSRDHRFSSRRVSPEDDQSLLIDRLPLFTFDSVSGRAGGGLFSGGDCPICLSKFEPHDQLRLLPICCHAFHAQCIDTWLQSNQSCPVCRSPIFASESEILSKVLNSSSAAGSGAGNHSFRIEIGNVSRRRQEISDSGNARRSYSIGSFDYVVEEDSEVTVVSNHARGFSASTVLSDKDDSLSMASKPTTEPPGPSLAAEVGSGTGRGWLRDYVDMISDRVSLSSRAISFRSSGRFFTGSSRRSEVEVIGNCDVEASHVGEEISEMFRWFSGV